MTQPQETFIANDSKEISSRVAKSAVGDDGLLQGLRRLFASVAAKNVTEEAYTRVVKL